MSYKKVMSTLSKIENIENIKKMDEKPRLGIFSSIAKCEEPSQSTLFDDIKKLVSDPLYEESKCIKNSNVNSCIGYKEQYTTDVIEEELTLSEQEDIYRSLGL